MENFESVHISEEILMMWNSAYNNYQNQYNKIMRKAIERSGLIDLSLYLFRNQNDTISNEELSQRITSIIGKNLFSFLSHEEAETLTLSIQNLSNVLSSLINAIPQVHSLYGILENTNQKPDSMMLSMMSYHSMMKTVFQAIDVYAKIHADSLEIDILTNAEKYLTSGVCDYLRKAKNFAMGCALGDWNFVVQAANMFVFNSLGHKAGKKINYLLHEMIPAADLSYKLHAHRCPPVFPSYMLHGVPISFQNSILKPRFELAKGLKGFVGFDERFNCYVLSLRGTNNAYNVLTDIHQALFGADITYLMSVGILGNLVAQHKEANICVVGHSLGGGLAQYATLAIDSPNINTCCYNSAGLSKQSIAQLKNQQLNNSVIEHLHIENDIVFKIGNQLGSYFSIPAGCNPKEAHKMSTVRKQTWNFVEIWIR